MAIDEITVKLSDRALVYCIAGGAEAGLSREEFAASLIESVAHDDLIAQGNAEALAAGEALFKPHIRAVR